MATGSFLSSNMMKKRMLEHQEERKNMEKAKISINKTFPSLHEFSK
jgi:hypothetical protein